MITEITAKNLKGLEFTQKIGPRTLFLGPNGQGKTARTQALTLALFGYIPGGENKTNEAVLTNFGNGDTLIVGFASNGIRFERAFGKTLKGAVSQAYKVNGKKATKELFFSSIGEAGRPKIIDLSTFLDLSDQKKIDYLLEIYPPEEDITALALEIRKAKEAYLALEDKARGAEASISSLSASRAAMGLPPGTLAEITSQVEKTEKEWAEATEALQKEKTARAEEKAREEQKEKDREAEEKRKNETQKPSESENKPADTAPVTASASTELETGMPPSGLSKPAEAVYPSGKPPLETANPEACVSISMILAALDGAGCSSCAARLVAMRELKKYRKEA